MRILSNQDFAKLVQNKLPKLKAIGSVKAEKDPHGFVSEKDVDEYISVLSYSEEKSANWLKSLKVLAKNGTLRRIQSGVTTWEDHLAEVHQKKVAGEISFDINDHVMLEDGKLGVVVDYRPEEKEFVVLLNPFEVKQVPGKDLSRVAQHSVDMSGMGPFGIGNRPREQKWCDNCGVDLGMREPNEESLCPACALENQEEDE